MQNGHSSQNTRFVKSAGPDLQQDQALRHHAPDVLGGEVSKDMMGAQSAAEYKLLIDLASGADGHFAQLRGHWALMRTGEFEAPSPDRGGNLGLPMGADLRRKISDMPG